VRGARAAAPIAALAALLAGALPFVVSVTAWPEIVTPAWFVTRGVRLYDGILFPHTPLLILLTAAAGALFGFTANVLRAIPALALAAAAALIVTGARPHRVSRAGLFAGLFAGLPLLALLCVYTEGPALWPEPFLAPFFLAGVLLLERHERTGGSRARIGAGLVFGLAILVKQTAAWPFAAALLWLAVRSRRGSLRGVAAFTAAGVLPYAFFALAWALAFRTLAHLRWTLFYPVFSGHAKEIAAPPSVADLHEALVLALPLAALLLAGRAGRTARLRSPLSLVALAAAGMAWPRFGLLHLAGAAGLVVLASCRATLFLGAIARRARALRGRKALVEAALSLCALATVFGVAAFGAGPLLVDAVGGPVFFWDDSTTRALAASVRARVPPGGEVFVFGAHQTLYPLTGTRAPGGFYVNPAFWYYLKRDHSDQRLVDALAASPGLPILFREPIADAERIRETAVYAFVKEKTRPAGNAGDAEWRLVPELRR
jgi:hypothetical protein